VPSLKFGNSNALPFEFQTTTTSSGFGGAGNGVGSFHDKMLGVVRRFCTSATSERIALQILASIPKGKKPTFKVFAFFWFLFYFNFV
jgi:hypothetical protein